MGSRWSKLENIIGIAIVKIPTYLHHLVVWSEKDLCAYPGSTRGAEEWDNTYKIKTIVERDIIHIKDNLYLAGHIIAILWPFGWIVSTPFEIRHTFSDINLLIELINSVESKSLIVMEHTGRFCKLFAHQLLSAISTLIKNFDNAHKIKSNQSDSVKIAFFFRTHSVDIYRVSHDI